MFLRSTKMESKKISDCCQKTEKQPTGLWHGIIFGLLPHSFCLGFIIFSVLGATVFSTIFRQFLLLPHFFEILVGVSFVLATASALIYLGKFNLLSVSGIQRKWRYLLILYGTTIVVNVLFLTVIFPRVAGMGTSRPVFGQNGLVTKTISVQIPCSGHAPLIIDELKKIDGVASVSFNNSGYFEIGFDPQKTTIEQILQAGIFKTYPATIVG